MAREDEIIAFSAIEKTGSITLTQLLRRHFGIRHFDCVDRRRTRGPLHHLAEDLRYDLKLHPWARSIAGHGLMPFIDYEELQDRLVFYTMLRDPVKRYVSMYKYETRHGWAKEGFIHWMRNSPRDNFQVRRLAGEENLEAAKTTVLEKMRAVGLLERYDESLLIFRQRLNIPDWDVAYGHPRNVGGDNEAFKRLPEFIERQQDEILQRNSLDILLYEFVRDEIWPTYVSDYGGSEKLENDLSVTFPNVHGYDKPNLKHYWRRGSNCAYRSFVYKPLAMLDRVKKRP